MGDKYREFISRFSTLSPEELRYEKLYKAGYLPSVPDYIKEPKDLSHSESEYIVSGDITIRKHPCFLPNYIHDHAFLEIPMVLRGKCIQRFYGEEFTLEEGDALIIAPGTYHSISVYDETTIVVNLLVKMETVGTVLAFEKGEESELGQFFDAIRENRISRTCVLLRGVSEVFELLPELEECSYRPLFLCTLARFFALLFRCQDYRFPITPTAKNDRLTRILETISNDTGNATLTSVAEANGLSAGYLSALLHEKTGLTFSHLVAKQKIQAACEMLRTSPSLSNVDIVSKLKMNPQQFCRFFKKWMGKTPQEYRKTG